MERKAEEREARSLSCRLTLSIKEYLFLLCSALYLFLRLSSLPSLHTNKKKTKQNKTKQKCLNLVSFCKHLLLEGDFDGGEKKKQTVVTAKEYEASEQMNIADQILVYCILMCNVCAIIKP